MIDMIKKTTTIKVLTCIISLLVFTSLSGEAKSAKSVINSAKAKHVEHKFTNLEEAQLTKINLYLNKIKNFNSDFEQVTNRGEIGYGKFYLSRPGKIRWEYNTPSPILIIGKGKLIGYYDKELDELSYIGIKNTLAFFLTKENIDLNKDVNILNINISNDVTKITFKDKNTDDEMSVTLVFSNEPIELVGMEVIDNIGKRTTLTFTTINKPAILADDLFKFPQTRSRRK